MSRDLKARIARLERQRHRRPFPRVIFAILDKQPEDVIGYEGDRTETRLTILRQPGEPLEALQARASELVGSPHLFTLYAPSPARQSGNLAPAPTATPEPALVDPWALSGMGREASRDELIQMGVIPVPSERLV